MSMTLYTVIRRLESMVSRFDSKGNKVSDEVTFVEHVIHDMPYSTAQMYLKNSAEGTCEVIRQAPFEKHSWRENIRTGSSTASSKRAAPTKTPAREKPDADLALKKAAAAGDMAAAINRSAA